MTITPDQNLLGLQLVAGVRNQRALKKQRGVQTLTIFEPTESLQSNNQSYQC